MPTVVAGALVSAIGLTGVAGTVATALIGAGASFALNSLAAKPATAKRTIAADSGRRIELVRDATLPRRVVYGRARVSGPLAFAHTANGPGGQVNAVLHLVVPLAMHEINGIGTLYVNDEAVAPRAGAQGWQVPQPGSRYYNPPPAVRPTKANPHPTPLPADGVAVMQFVQWRNHLGAPNDAADSFLVSNSGGRWTAAHKLAGVAYAYVQLMWDQNVWSGGLPNLSFIVEGRRLFDPRTGNTAFSSNPALVIRDYLRAPWGLGCQADEIDEPSFIAAANLCDEPVPTGAGAEQKRYTCDGVISTDEKPIDVMEKLLSSCAGALVYTQGTYKLYPAAYRTPLVTIDAGQLRDTLKVRPQPPRKDRVNTVRGSFIDPARGWQSNEFPPVSAAGYLAADGFELVRTDVELPFTTDVYTAQRLARLQLERARRQLTVELPLTLSGLAAAVMEPLKLSIPALDWREKVFTPTEWTLNAAGGVDLVAIEDDPALYAWSGGASAGAAPPVALPNIYPEAPFVTVSDTVVMSAGLGAIALVITLDADADAFTSRFEVEYRRPDDEAWRNAGSGARLTVTGVNENEVYEVRARALNVLGLASSWASVTHQVVGAAAPPADVTGLTTSLIDTTLSLEWSAAGGLTGEYRLRWSPLTVGAAWASAVDIALTPNTRASLPARVGAYLVKAVDSAGRESVNAAAAVNLVNAGGLNPVATRTEHPAFTGAKTNCVVNGSNQLVIDSLTAFEAQHGDFDAMAGDFDVAGGGAAATGVYEFATPVDFGQVYSGRITATVKASVIDLVNAFEAAADDFDAREGAFDGDAPSAVDVVLEVATTQIDPAGAAVWSAWARFSVGDYTARGFKFRARLVTRNPMATPAVEQLTVVAEMPDRIAAGADAVSATAGTTVTFSPAFKVTPAIIITPQNLNTGDYWAITSKSRTGFTVQFKDSAGAGINRTFDWTARGYGRQQ